MGEGGSRERESERERERERWKRDQVKQGVEREKGVGGWVKGGDVEKRR